MYISCIYNIICTRFHFKVVPGIKTKEDKHPVEKEALTETLKEKQQQFDNISDILDAKDINIKELTDLIATLNAEKNVLAENYKQQSIEKELLLAENNRLARLETVELKELKDKYDVLKRDYDKKQLHHATLKEELADKELTIVHLNKNVTIIENVLSQTIEDKKTTHLITL